MRLTIGVTSPQPSGEEPLGSEVRKHAKLLHSLGANVVVLTRGRGTAEALERTTLHAVVFSGGGDVTASLYGGRADLSWDRTNLERDEGELALLQSAFAQRVPMLCVCRGIGLVRVSWTPR